MSQGDEWSAVAEILERIERLLLEANDEGAAQITSVRVQGQQGDRAAAIKAATSGDMWNHMGSFFDRSLADRGLDRQFGAPKIGLAEALEQAGIATADVRLWAATFRAWESQGL